MSLLPKACIVFALTLVACGGSTSEPSDPAVTPSVSSDAGSPVSTDGGCSDLENVGSPAPSKKVAAAAPAATGGTVADGTYVLTDATEYTGPGGTEGDEGTKSMTLRITGSRGESNFDGVARASTFRFEGTHILSENVCPSTGSDDSEYTADATTFAIQTKRSASVFVQTFTLLPK